MTKVAFSATAGNFLHAMIHEIVFNCSATFCHYRDRMTTSEIDDWDFQLIVNIIYE